MSIKDNNEYILKISNAFARKNGVKNKSLEVSNNLRITNYYPDKSNGKSKGLITIDFTDGKSSIKEGVGDRYSKNLDVAKFSNKKFEVLKEIAGLDGNAENLTLKDLLNINKLNKTKFGIEKLKKDFKAGIATIFFGKTDKDMLRIDFETSDEVKKNSNTSQKASASLKKTLSDLKHEIDNPAIYHKVTSKYSNYISKLAKKSGFSEYFIKHLLSTENFIPVVKDIKDGQLTGGFGHTNKTESNNKIKRGQKVSLSTAFKWLEQDIRDKEKIIKKNFKDYDKYPRSIKEALIDIAFNRGKNIVNDEKIYASLRANLDLGKDYLPAAAVRMRQEDKLGPKFGYGLRKRNVYRFLLAIRDFSPEDKLAAMRRFRSPDDYLNKTISSLNQKGYTLDSKYLMRLWSSVKEEAELQSRKTR